MLQIICFITCLFILCLAIFLFTARLDNNKGLPHEALLPNQIEDRLYHQLYGDLEVCDNSVELFFLRQDVIRYSNRFNVNTELANDLENLYTQKALAIGGERCVN